jgi:hypothetical protein
MARLLPPDLTPALASPQLQILCLLLTLPQAPLLLRHPEQFLPQPVQKVAQQQPPQPPLRHLRQQNLQRSFPPRMPSPARSLAFWLLPFDLAF